MNMRKDAPKHMRLQVILDHLQSVQPAHSALEAYKILSESINLIEDRFLGKDTYNPPRSLVNVHTPRMYPTNLESAFPVAYYKGVHILLSSNHITLISRYGAIEIQNKVTGDKRGENVHFKEREHEVIFRKLDAYGDGVWCDKNK